MSSGTRPRPGPPPPSVALSADRGEQLNRRRLRGEGVDVRFRIGEEVFPAHFLVVSFFSPYLKALARPHDGFGPAGHEGEPVNLSGVDPATFGVLLKYAYTGRIVVDANNAFDLVEAARFLQVEEESPPHLVDACDDFLSRRLPSCDLTEFFRIWNLGEQFDLPSVRAAVKRTLEFRLDEFLATCGQEFFSSLGHSEISALLDHRDLCLSSERALFDAVAEWCADNVDGAGDHEGCRLAAQLLGKLQLSQLSLSYLRTSLNDVLGEANVSELERAAGSSDRRRRSCTSCVYLFEYTRSESDILGIREFVEDRKGAPTFAYLDLGVLERTGGTCFFTAPLLTQGKSYFQHYGPHSSSHYELAAAGSKLLSLGGVKRVGQREKLLSNEVRTFDAEASACWDSLGGVMPKDLVNFAAAVPVGDDLVIVLGGLTDTYSPGSSKSTFMKRKVNVSQEVFSARVSDLTGMNAWKRLSPMPIPRMDFSALCVDGTVCVVGDGFCDFYSVATDRWTTSADVPAGFGPSPALASAGSSLYVFGSRPEADANVFRRYDLADGTWSPVPVPSVTRRFSSGQWEALPPSSQSRPVRQDVSAAFGHNGRVYLLGWQAAFDNMLHSFDPASGEWTMLAQRMRGGLRKGVLLRRQRTNPAVLYGGAPIRCAVATNPQ